MMDQVQQVFTACPDCDGTGNDAQDMKELEMWGAVPALMACSKCHGTGLVKLNRSKPYINTMPPIICKKHKREDCEECGK